MDYAARRASLQARRPCTAAVGNEQRGDARQGSESVKHRRPTDDFSGRRGPHERANEDRYRRPRPVSALRLNSGSSNSEPTHLLFGRLDSRHYGRSSSRHLEASFDAESFIVGRTISELRVAGAVLTSDDNRLTQCHVPR